jgi:hypothetical protein
MVQWQWATQIDGSSIEKDTAPHKHLPDAAMILPFTCPARRYAARAGVLARALPGA